MGPPEDVRGYSPGWGSGCSPHPVGGGQRSGSRGAARNRPATKTDLVPKGRHPRDAELCSVTELVSTQVLNHNESFLTRSLRSCGRGTHGRLQALLCVTRAACLASSHAIGKAAAFILYRGHSARSVHAPLSPAFLPRACLLTGAAYQFSAHLLHARGKGGPHAQLWLRGHGSPHPASRSPSTKMC